MYHLFYHTQFPSVILYAHLLTLRKLLWWKMSNNKAELYLLKCCIRVFLQTNGTDSISMVIDTIYHLLNKTGVRLCFLYSLYMAQLEQEINGLRFFYFKRETWTCVFYNNIIQGCCTFKCIENTRKRGCCSFFVEY